jgi:hypothetical protein
MVSVRQEAGNSVAVMHAEYGVTDRYKGSGACALVGNLEAFVDHVDNQQLGVTGILLLWERKAVGDIPQVALVQGSAEERRQRVFAHKLLTVEVDPLQRVRVKRRGGFRGLLVCTEPDHTHSMYLVRAPVFVALSGCMPGTSGCTRTSVLV